MSWIIGGKSPGDWFENNVVFGAKNGIEVGTLDCVHFPQVSVLEVLAARILKFCGISG